ncbi:TIGR00269 family protein [Candidatus Woesearchaeota archaeon]|nr:TIGR00269 family protein [Candidatus Woesearchaeota archaeon]
MISIEQKTKKNIQNYNLISRKDKILVACSGGKDSTTVLYILKKLGYNVSAITVDALIGNYTKQNLENIKKVCKESGVKLHVVSFRDEFGASLCYLKSMLSGKGVKLGSCTICGVLRRYLLNKYAKKLKADVIATGHNMDDEVQSVLMNLFKNNLELLARSGPKTGVSNYKSFIPRIKPLYFVSEKEVKEYSKSMNFPVNYNACPCRVDAYRNHVRKLLDNYEKINPDVKKNIIDNFLKILPLLKKKFKTIEKPLYCKSCGEPSKREKCMTCQILSKLRS